MKLQCLSFSPRVTTLKRRAHSAPITHQPIDAYPSRNVGVDPGKRNILTVIIDENELTLKYTSCQRVARFHAIKPEERVNIFLRSIYNIIY